MLGGNQDKTHDTVNQNLRGLQQQPAEEKSGHIRPSRPAASSTKQQQQHRTPLGDISYKLGNVAIGNRNSHDSTSQRPKTVSKVKVLLSTKNK